MTAFRTSLVKASKLLKREKKGCVTSKWENYKLGRLEYLLTENTWRQILFEELNKCGLAHKNTEDIINCIKLSTTSRCLSEYFSLSLMPSLFSNSVCSERSSVMKECRCGGCWISKRKVGVVEQWLSFITCKSKSELFIHNLSSSACQPLHNSQYILSLSAIISHSELTVEHCHLCLHEEL